MSLVQHVSRRKATNDAREKQRALKAAKKAHELLLPFARSSAPTPGFASYVFFLCIWHVRPVAQHFPRRVLVKLFGRFWASFIACGGETGISALP